jgi:hypothetical protein
MNWIGGITGWAALVGWDTLLGDDQNNRKHTALWKRLKRN